MPIRKSNGNLHPVRKPKEIFRATQGNLSRRPSTNPSTHNLDRGGGSKNTSDKHQLDRGGGARVSRTSGSHRHNLDQGSGARKESLYTTADKALRRASSGIPAASPFSKQGIRNNANARNYDPRNGREWADHKYIDKVKTKTGKWRYIYDEKTGNMVRKRDAASRNLEASAKRAGQRNTGRPDSMRGLAGALNQAKSAGAAAARSAQRAGSDFVKAAQDAWASTPLSKLFG